MALSGAVVDITSSVFVYQIKNPLPFRGLFVVSEMPPNGPPVAIYDEKGLYKQNWSFLVGNEKLDYFIHTVLPNNTFWGLYKAGNETDMFVYRAELPKIFPGLSQFFSIRNDGKTARVLGSTFNQALGKCYIKVFQGSALKRATHWYIKKLLATSKR
ncbi:hypothetical protein G9A89_004573 [Geosiphon pyriformis]|nr:hypothetical protein G9A89_004573 [Geosiphon pyriformis]